MPSAAVNRDGRDQRPHCEIVWGRVEEEHVIDKDKRKYSVKKKVQK